MMERVPMPLLYGSLVQEIPVLTSSLIGKTLQSAPIELNKLPNGEPKGTEELKTSRNTRVFERPMKDRREPNIAQWDTPRCSIMPNRRPKDHL